jgi:tetratricopeptide (TPR) repeat protein
VKPNSTVPDHEPVVTATDLGKVYDRLVGCLYERQNAARARRYAKRLKQLVKAFDPNAESAYAQECLSLTFEAEGDREQAIRHRKNEIALIRRLHELAHGPDAAHTDYILGQYSYADLRDRLELLAMLYHDNGDINNAINMLEEAKELSLDHGIPFDSEDLIRQYMDERPSKTLYLLYLWVSENGVLSGKEASNRLESTMPSANTTRIAEPQEATRPVKFLSPRATERPAAGGAVVGVEED